MTIPANAHRDIIEAIVRLLASPSREGQHLALVELVALVNSANLSRLSGVEIIPDTEKLATIKCSVPDRQKVDHKCLLNPGALALAVLFAVLQLGPYIDFDGKGRRDLKVNYGRTKDGKGGKDTVIFSRLLLEIDRADPKARARYVNGNTLDLRCSNLMRPKSSPVVAAEPTGATKFELLTELDPRSLEAAWSELIGELASPETLFDGSPAERFDSANRLVFGVRELVVAEMEQDQPTLKGAA